MNIGIDIDGVLTIETEGHDYENRTPNLKMIQTVKQWYTEGHKITIFSARWCEDEAVTLKWLRKYNVPFHKILLNKPKFDLYIDDKSMRPEEVE